jgi:Peptidase inhibitor I78 family
MRFAARLMILPLASWLAACVPPEPEPNVPIDPIPVDQCGAADLQFLVGQNARVLQAMRFAQTVRVIQPGMAVTMDFLPQRLNIWLVEGASGDVIDRVTCG